MEYFNFFILKIVNTKKKNNSFSNISRVIQKCVVLSCQLPPSLLFDEKSNYIVCYMVGLKEDVRNLYPLSNENG